MMYLIAQAAGGRHRWRRPLRENQPLILGRTGADLSVPWDPAVSRRHCQLVCQSDRLYIQQLDGASNPTFYQGRPIRALTLGRGEHFVIGQTVFRWADDHAEVSLQQPLPVSQQTFSAPLLQQVAFRNARRQIETLSRIPEWVAVARSDEDLFTQLVGALLSGVGESSAAAVVRGHGEPTSVQIVHWDDVTDRPCEFRPSARLIRQALATQESVVHVWASGQTADPYTQTHNANWAFCTPLPGSAADGLAFYVAGSSTNDQQARIVQDPNELLDDLKFVQILAATVGNMLELRALERQQAVLSRFFSRPVLQQLRHTDPASILAPREASISALFCDLRGFSRQAEQAQDQLMELLERTSSALSSMTAAILAQGGVVGDFHGDAVMGFWGWPAAQDDRGLRACRAALAIHEAFSAPNDQHDALLSPPPVGTGIALSAVRGSPDPSAVRGSPDPAPLPSPPPVGIGIASGLAVAGLIGSRDQVKVTAFGPVVNLAARLEGMTRAFGVSIILDEQTANEFCGLCAEGAARVRCLARVRPFGMKSALRIYELLAADATPSRDHDLEIYRSALEAFEAGNWHQAAQQFERLVERDPAARALRHWMDRCGQRIPDSWDGVVEMGSK